MINNNMRTLKRVIDKIALEGKPIIAYGAPTKIVLLLKVAKLNFNDIEFVVEDNEEKVEKYLPITGIKIKSVKELNKNFNGNILITAWNFSDDIKEKLKNKFKNNINIIIPIPDVRIEKI